MDNAFQEHKKLIVTCLLIILLWGIGEARSFLIPLAIAALLAFTMAPIVRVMRRYRFPEWSAITVSTTFLILPILSLLSVGVWQGQALIRDFPSKMIALNHALNRFVNSDVGIRLQLAKDFNLDQLVKKFEVNATQSIQIVISGMGALLGAGSQLALVLLFSVLMLASRRHLHRSAKKIIRQNISEKQSQILEDVVTLIEKFLIARLLIVVIVGGVDTTILSVFQIEYSLLLGVFLGLMTLIPAVGFIMGVLPPIILSFGMGNSFLKTFVMFVALFAVSIIEGNVLTPQMVGRRLNINALATFVGLFGGSLLWGVWGMFLSIPILGVLRIILNASPTLHAWGELLADRDDKILKLRMTQPKEDQVA